MKILPLEKGFRTNVEYKAEHNKFYVFKYLGTNVDIEYIEVEGRRTTPLDAELSPQFVTSSNLFGQLDLKDQYIVIPPLHRFKFVSASDGVVRVSGTLGILEFGEGIPADLQTRFRNMHISYLKPIVLSKTLPTDQSISPGAEVEIGTIAPSTIERYILASIAGIKGTNLGTVEAGDLGVRIYYDDTPLDILSKEGGQLGIDFLSMPLPPTMTTNMEAFTFEDNPIVVEPNHKLRFALVNNKTTAITPPAGQSISITLKLVALYNIIG